MKTELKDRPGDKCPRTKAEHTWDYFVPEALPSHVKEARRCIYCGTMQALSHNAAKAAKATS